MSPQAETALLALLERIAIALEKSGGGISGVSGATGSASKAGGSSAEVPFGKNKGVRLADLGNKSLSFYAYVWAPTTSEKYPKPSDRDLAFHRAAKDEAKARGLVDDRGSEAQSAPSMPVSAPKSADDGEDVPF